jgi:hypothetical protein
MVASVPVVCCAAASRSGRRVGQDAEDVGQLVVGRGGGVGEEGSGAGGGVGGHAGQILGSGPGERWDTVAEAWPKLAGALAGLVHHQDTMHLKVDVPPKRFHQGQHALHEH